MAGTRALFPLDGSEPTYQAVEGGLKRMAGLKDARATFLVVVDEALRKMPKDAREYLEFDDEDELFIRDDEAKSVLAKAETLAKKHKCKSESRIVSGRVFDAILAEAGKHDILVMHRLDREEHKEKARGGILEKLCRHAPCDVWLIHTD
jgi:nucleotide-binding universal stress UspA family protein